MDEEEIVPIEAYDAISVLMDHGYADSDTYGQCFCGEVHEDSFDMAKHIFLKLQAAGVLKDV